MNAYILEDAAGKFWQYLDPEVAEYSVRRGKDVIYGESQLGGYYTIDCRPATPEQVTMPVTVKWARDTPTNS